MFSEGDEHQGVVIGVLFGVIALVIGLVISLGVYQTRLVKQRNLAAAGPAIAVLPGAGVPAVVAVGPGNSGVAVVGPGTSAGAAAPASGAALGAGLAGVPGIAVEIAAVRIYFEPGQTALPAGAGNALSGVAQQVLAGRSVSITGWYDAAGDAARNADIARLRAIQVRDLLASLGVPPDRMQLNQSTTLGSAAGAADAQAQRVEVRVY